MPLKRQVSSDYESGPPVCRFRPQGQTSSANFCPRRLLNDGTAAQLKSFRPRDERGDNVFWHRFICESGSREFRNKCVDVAFLITGNLLGHKCQIPALALQAYSSL